MRRGLWLTLAVVAVLIVGGWLAARHILASDLLRSTLEQQIGDRLGSPVHIAAATVSLFPRVGVDLHDVTIGTSPVVTVGHVELRTGLGALLSHRIEDADVVLADGRIPWPLPFSLAPASTGAGKTASVTIRSINRIEFKNITIVSNLPPLTLDLDAALHGDQLDIERIDASAGTTRLQASGALDSISGMHGTLAVKGNIDVDGYSATSVSASAALARDTLTLAPLSFGIFGGRFQGRLAADLRGVMPKVKLAGDLSGINVAQAMQRSGAPGGITGTLHGHIQAAASGSDGSALLRTTTGQMTAEILDGTIPHLDLVRAIVLAFGKPDSASPAGSGSAFESLGGAFVVGHGTLSSDAITLRSRDFDTVANGRLRLDAGALDARANVVLSRELTAQAGTDLRRYAAQDGRVIIPVTISGTLSNPTVFVDLAAAAKRAVGNEIKRRLGKLLGGVIKRKGGG